MKLIVCGAAGMTGTEVVREALEVGHQVTAVVRSPEYCTIIHDNLTVAIGNLFEKSTLDAIFPGHDAVINCAGFPKKPVPVTGYTDTIPNIIGAMRDANISRIIVQTAWYTDRKSAGRAGFWAKWILVPVIKNIIINMHQMEMYIEANCQDMNYTVVRPPGLNRRPKTGLDMMVAEDYFVKSRRSIDRISREDVASYLVSILESQEYNNKMIAIITEQPPDPLY